MDSDLTLLVCCAGITFGLVNAEVFEPVRNYMARSYYLQRMLQCAYCTGFWVGIFGTALVLWADIMLKYPVTIEHGYSCVAQPLFGGVYLMMMGFGSAILSLVLDRLALLGDMSEHIAAAFTPEEVAEDEEDDG